MLSEKGRTPCVMAKIEPVAQKEGKATNIMIYGHLDKQPPLEDQWTDGLKPYEPILRKQKLYGRGSADDGYAFFLAVSLIKTLQQFKEQKCRVVLFFETDEESGSKDLIYFIKQNKDVIGQIDMLFCLDSGSISTEHLCMTTTLRGVMNFEVTARMLT